MNDTKFTVLKGTENEFAGTLEEIANFFKIEYRTLLKASKNNTLDEVITEKIGDSIILDGNINTSKQNKENFNILIESINREDIEDIKPDYSDKESYFLMKKCRDLNKDYNSVIEYLMDGYSEYDALQMTDGLFNEVNNNYRKTSQDYSYFCQARRLGLKNRTQLTRYQNYCKNHGYTSPEEFLKIISDKDKEKECQKEFNDYCKKFDIGHSVKNEYKSYYDKGIEYFEFIDKYYSKNFKNTVGYEGNLSNRDLICRLEFEGVINERDKKVLLKRYIESKSLEETGKEFNITRERIRQIEVKALRKSRHYLGMTNNFNDFNKNSKELSLDDPISLLNLSVRSYNCLKRCGIKTVRDLLNYSFNELCKIRNLGMTSLREVISKTKKYYDKFSKDSKLGFNEGQLNDFISNTKENQHYINVLRDISVEANKKAKETKEEITEKPVESNALHIKRNNKKDTKSNSSDKKKSYYELHKEERKAYQKAYMKARKEEKENSKVTLVPFNSNDKKVNEGIVLGEPGVSKPFTLSSTIVEKQPEKQLVLFLSDEEILTNVTKIVLSREDNEAVKKCKEEIENAVKKYLNS